MPRAYRTDIEELKNGLEQLRVVLSVSDPHLAGKIDFRRNILADYTAAFSAEFLTTQILNLIAVELQEEILKEMRKDRRTARLADGIANQPIQEKRRGTWRTVPKPEVEGLVGSQFRTPLFGDESSPIRIEVFAEGDQAVLTVQLQDPLYIIMHSGARPHNVPPINQFHVFPTRELIARRPEAEYSKYGPHFFRLRSVPWREKNGPRTERTYEQDRRGRWRLRLRPVALKRVMRELPSPGFGPRVPFITLAWRRVITRNRRRTQETITRRLQGRGL